MLNIFKNLYNHTFDFWCGFDRASSLICGNKMPTRCNRGFIADLIACSTRFGHHYANHQELKSIITWLPPVVFRAVDFKLLLWCGAEDYVTVLQDAADQQLENHCTKYHRQHCIIILGSWWWVKWCPKHFEQATRSAIKTSVTSSWHFISTYLHLIFLIPSSYKYLQNVALFHFVQNTF